MKLAVSSVRGIVDEGDVVKRRREERVEREEGKERGREIYLSDLASMRLIPASGCTLHRGREMRC